MSLEKVLDYLPVLRQRCRGGVFVSVLIFTAFGGFLLFCPLFFLVFGLQFASARWITDTIISTWFALAVATYELVYGVKIRITGDVRGLNKNNCTLIIMNHRTRLDWLFFFSVQARYGSLRRFKICLKDELKHLPGAGWAMQAASFLFLVRKWDQDRERIEESFKYFNKYSYSPQLLFFPEGTDFQNSSREKSKSYAKKNDLEEYDYVLHPRTTGFTSVVNYMKEYNKLDQIVDVTVAYPQNILQRETDLIYGDIPREIVFNVNCFDLQDVPVESEPSLGRWMESLWKEKEMYLRNFYEKRECQENLENGLRNGQNVEIQRDTNAYLVAALVFWFFVCVMILWCLTVSQVFRWYFVGACVMYTIMSSTVGFDRIFKHLAGK